MTAVTEVSDAQLARRSGASTAAKVATLLLQTAHLAVLARTLPEPTFAAFAAATAVLVILGALAEFGLVHSAVLALADGVPEARVVRATMAASCRLIGAALAVAALVAALFLDGDARLAVALLVPWFVLSRLDSALVAAHQARLRTTRLAMAEVVSRGVLLVAALPLVAADAWSTTEVLLVVAVGFALSEAASFALLIPGVPWSAAGAGTGTDGLLRRALPLGLANATSLVHARSDQVVLEAMGRRSGLGAYAIAFRVNEAMLALAGAAGTVTFPLLAGADPATRAARAQRIVRVATLLAVVAGTAVFIAAPTIAELVGGGRYEEAGHLGRLLVPALAASMVNLPVAQVAIVAGGATRLLRLAVGAVVVNLVLTVVLVAELGASGAAVATAISEVGVLVVGAWIATRLVPGAVPWLPVLLVPLLVSAPLWLALERWRAGDPWTAAAAVGAVAAVLWANRPKVER